MKRLVVAGLAAGLTLCHSPVSGASRSPASVGLHLSQVRDRTVIASSTPGGPKRLVLPPEEGIYAGSLSDTQVIGIVPGRVVILRSDYASRPHGATHQCGAGTETVLRVVALRPFLRQTFHQLLESCWTTIDDGAVDWNPKSRQLTVERTTYEPETRHVRTRYQVTDAGEVVVLSEALLP